MSPEISVQKGEVKYGAFGIVIGLRLLKDETSHALLGLPFKAIGLARSALFIRDFPGVIEALAPLIGNDYSTRFSEALKKGVEGASITFKPVMVKVTDEIETYKVVRSNNL